MRSIVIIFILMIFAGGCRSIKHEKDALHPARVCGITYNTVNRTSPLNGTFIINATRGGGTVADSLGYFCISAFEGDSLRFEYVGMKSRTIAVSSKDSTYWNVGMDTLYLILHSDI